MGFLFSKPLPVAEEAQEALLALNGEPTEPNFATRIPENITSSTPTLMEERGGPSQNYAPSNPIPIGSGNRSEYAFGPRPYTNPPYGMGFDPQDSFPNGSVEGPKTLWRQHFSDIISDPVAWRRLLQETEEWFQNQG